MTRRLVLEWPDPRPFRARDGAPIRILALSDDLDSTLTDHRNREALLPIDMLLGCGDLDFDDLGYVADALNAPLVYVRGNHDFKSPWEEGTCPQPLGSPFLVKREGLTIGGLEWPGHHHRGNGRSEVGAWRHSISLVAHHVGHTAPLIVISHVPPAGAGDVPTDAYHRGFEGYAWAMRHLHPLLWLHGHTPLAASPDWHTKVDGTEVVNVTGAVLVELLAPGSRRATNADGSEPKANAVANRAEPAVEIGDGRDDRLEESAQSRR